jgi:hypothetical protein
MFIKNYGLP